MCKTFFVFFCYFFIVFNMNSADLCRKMKQLRNEELVWIIYIGIIAFSFYSNFLERRYFFDNDFMSGEKYRKVMISIFLILVVIYLYFLQDSYEDFRNISSFDSDEKKKLVTLSFVASLFIAISGFIFLYIAFFDKQFDVELAFN